MVQVVQAKEALGYDYAMEQSPKFRAVATCAEIRTELRKQVPLVKFVAASTKETTCFQSSTQVSVKIGKLQCFM